MRIALVHPYPWGEVRRGGERYLGDLVWYLTGAGHEVDVLTSVPGPGRTWTEDGATVRAWRRLEHPGLAHRSVTAVQTHALGALVGLLRRRYDVVHALTPLGALAGALARQRVVYTELGHPAPGLLDGYPGGRHVFRVAVRGAAAVTALSGSAAESLRAVTGLDVEVQAPGVRTDRFVTDDVPRAKPPRLLFVSDAGGWRKRVDLAIAAYARLRAELPDLRLELAGPGAHRWALEELGLLDDDVVDGIHADGVAPQDELPGRYARAAATLLPSTHEAFGLVLVESMACGTPVVCSDGWGMAEIVADPAVGRTFRPGDVDDLVRAVREALELAADPATRARCRSHAERWGWSVVGPQHEARYRRVARTS